MSDALAVVPADEADQERLDRLVITWADAVAVIQQHVAGRAIRPPSCAVG